MFCGGGGRFSGSSYIPACWLKTGCSHRPPKSLSWWSARRSLLILGHYTLAAPVGGRPVVKHPRRASASLPPDPRNTKANINWPSLFSVHFINIHHLSPKKSSTNWDLRLSPHTVSILLNPKPFPYCLDKDRWGSIIEAEPLQFDTIISLFNSQCESGFILTDDGRERKHRDWQIARLVIYLHKSQYLNICGGY